MLRANLSMDNKVKYLKKQGARIGNNTRLMCKVSAFGSEPYLIEVGENCLFSQDVHLVTHDGGIKVLNSLGFFDGEIMDKIDRINIGNNVFIGHGVYIMPGVNIGNNSIVGAGAIVTKDIPEGSVAVGVPAKVIMSIQDYYEKTKKQVFPTAQLNKVNKREYFSKYFDGK